MCREFFWACIRDNLMRGEPETKFERWLLAACKRDKKIAAAVSEFVTDHKDLLECLLPILKLKEKKCQP